MHADWAVRIAYELGSPVAALLTLDTFGLRLFDGSGVILGDICGSLGFGSFLIGDVFIWWYLLFLTRGLCWHWWGCRVWVGKVIWFRFYDDWCNRGLCCVCLLLFVDLTIECIYTGYVLNFLIIMFFFGFGSLYLLIVYLFYYPDFLRTCIVLNKCWLQLQACALSVSDAIFSLISVLKATFFMNE